MGKSACGEPAIAGFLMLILRKRGYTQLWVMVQLEIQTPCSSRARYFRSLILTAIGVVCTVAHPKCWGEASMLAL